MPLEKIKSSKPYVTIIDGTLKQKVTKETEGAELREWELKDGTKGSKWELSYQSISGLICDLRLKEGEYGQTLEVDFGDAILSMNTESRYFGDFVKKLIKVDVDKEISVSPFDFVGDKGKPIKGVTIYNDGVKMLNYYWDATEGKPCNNMPQPVGDTSKFDNDDWKVYFIGVKKFLIEELKTVMDKVEEADNKAQTSFDQPADDIPTINIAEELEEAGMDIKEGDETYTMHYNDLKNGR